LFFGAPDPAAPPCIRQRRFPLTAGDRHGWPERVRARRRALANIGPVLRGWSPLIVHRQRVSSARPARVLQARWRRRWIAGALDRKPVVHASHLLRPAVRDLVHGGAESGLQRQVLSPCESRWMVAAARPVVRCCCGIAVAVLGRRSTPSIWSGLRKKLLLLFPSTLHGVVFKIWVILCRCGTYRPSSKCERPAEAVRRAIHDSREGKVHCAG
jgi:hypothetical protein